MLSGGSVSGLTEDGVSVLLYFFMCNVESGCYLFLTKNGSFTKDQYRRSVFFKKGLLYYPEQSKETLVPGFQSKNNLFRSQALIRLTNKKGGCCLSTIDAAKSKNINKKIIINRQYLNLGETVDRDGFIENLLVFGYVVVDSVYNPGDVAVRGDIVDVFPENKKHPVRISFSFNCVDSLSFFDIDTQRRGSNINSVCFYDLIGDPVQKGKSLLGFIRWDIVFSVVQDKQNYRVFMKGGGGTNLVVDCIPLQKDLKTENLFFNYIKKTRLRTHVFYTNKKREPFLGVLGIKPLPGLIKKAFKAPVFDSVFLPDFKEKTKTKHKNKIKHKSLLLNGLSTVSLGDLVVHVHHGVGEFSGLVIRGPRGFEKECIKITYRSGGLLFVPIDKLELVHRYLGFEKKHRVSALGKKTWNQGVEKTKKSLEAVSLTLVGVYTSREKPRGFSYEKNNEIMAALKKSFPYKETKDQKNTIKEVLGDLDGEQPMDRLVCGDVGFGKTEVALRATIKAVTSNKQVVFLCPTTVLSDQHFITAKERMEPLGVRVVLLSRFQTKKEQKKILIEMLKGRVDLIIGTHRLLSDDVVVPSLGLLIIDEEHRFGVKHKEKIRSLRFGVDVLSLSATPIPRTLQQSMLGIRDISRIETPPTTRKPIKTFVEYFSWEKSVNIIKDELLRGGQVYFLHNNILSIDYYTDKLRGFLPKENIQNIHGQQDNKTLEKNLLGFFNGGVSVLVCSTIIESGLDVSNANCIIINNPQNLGLSQLYQIRGRVGRGSRQAFCYLFVPQKTKLSDTAFRRLKTIERHTSLGSGYNIATNDLSIRGAGSVLGYKQSGQVSQVGLEYYNKLLKEAVNKKLNKPVGGAPVDIVFYGKALILKRYISNERVRFSFYTKINTAETVGVLNEIKEELLDRFGKIPAETSSFINLAVIKLFYKETGVLGITIKRDSFVFELVGEKLNEETINSVLLYKNEFVLGQKFKESGSNVFIVFRCVSGFSWFDLLLDCRRVLFGS